MIDPADPLDLEPMHPCPADSHFLRVVRAALALALNERDYQSGRLIDRTGARYRATLARVDELDLAATWCRRRLGAAYPSQPQAEPFGADDIDDIPF